MASSRRRLNRRPQADSRLGATAKFQDLPAEVLSEIASRLSYTDILAIRLVNKALRDATNSRAVCLSVATQYANDLCKQPEFGTKSLNSLSTPELRKWLAKRVHVDDLWGKSEKHGARPRSRILNAPTFSSIRVTRLIPGGRWLLAGLSWGGICYYDLEAEDPAPVCLVPDPGADIQGARSV